MIDFADEFLTPMPGSISYFGLDRGEPLAGTWRIEVPLRPFSADDEYDPTAYRAGVSGPVIVSTAVILEFIRLPAVDLGGLSRRHFRFPVNAQSGYIDGSLYLAASHHPVDVTRIDFGEQDGDLVQAQFDACFLFEHESACLRNRNATLNTTLRLTG